MGRPDMVPQRVVPLIPPVFGHHHDAPAMMWIFQIQPMHLDGKGVIWPRLTDAVTGPSNTSNAPRGSFRGRLGGSANCLPGKQEAPVANAMVHTDLPHHKPNTAVQESSAIMAVEEGLHPHPNGNCTRGCGQRKDRDGDICQRQERTARSTYIGHDPTVDGVCPGRLPVRADGSRERRSHVQEMLSMQCFRSRYRMHSSACRHASLALKERR